MERGKIGDLGASDLSLKPSLFANPYEQPRATRERDGVFETQITSDYKAIGLKAVFPLSKGIRFIKDK